MTSVHTFLKPPLQRLLVLLDVAQGEAAGEVDRGVRPAFPDLLPRARPLKPFEEKGARGEVGDSGGGVGCGEVLL